MMNDFHTALFQANLLYGVDMQDSDFEEYALIAFKRIGNKRVRLYHLDTTVDPVDNSVELPCNCELIEAVTTMWEDWNYTSNIKINGDYNSAFTEQYIEARKKETNPLYVSGHFIKYEEIGNKLYFQKNFGRIHILYYGSVVDDDGLPMLTDAEVDAIAVFVAYVLTYKQGLASKNNQLLSVANDLRLQWAVKCDLARVPEYINQNEMNQILDAKMSWNRKTYNRSFKPLM